MTTIHHLVAWFSHEIKLQWFKLARISISYHSHQNGISSGWWLSPTLKNIWLRQLGSLFIIPNMMGKSIQIPFMFQSPPTIFLDIFIEININHHLNQYQSSSKSISIIIYLASSWWLWDLRTNQQRRSPEWSPKGGSPGLCGDSADKKRWLWPGNSPNFDRSSWYHVTMIELNGFHHATIIELNGSWFPELCFSDGG